MAKHETTEPQSTPPRPPRFDANQDVAERVVDRIMAFRAGLGSDTWHRYAVRQIKAALDAARGRRHG